MKVSAESPLFDGKVPHLLLKKGDIAPVVLLPGDPGRVEMFKELCDDFEIVADNREYKVGTGTFNGYPVSVCSTGIGAASTEIAVVELIELGAKVLIRIGGTGVIHKDLKVGDMVITTASMRQGGSSYHYAPLEYPAVASFEVVESLMEACKNRETIYTKGIGASIGSFFAGQGRPANGKNFNDTDIIKNYQRLNVINMEMEAETIITLSNVFGVMSGAICAIHANRVTDEWLYDFADAQRNMCQIALDSVELLYKRYL